MAHHCKEPHIQKHIVDFHLAFERKKYDAHDDLAYDHFFALLFLEKWYYRKFLSLRMHRLGIYVRTNTRCTTAVVRCRPFGETSSTSLEKGAEIEPL